MIKIYTSPSCGNCMLLKDILDEHGYEYEEQNILDEGFDVKELSSVSECGGIPIVEKDGKYHCSFDEQEVLDFLM